ncbi:hypothetical protein D9758_004378 [Tetrapyrgos nigripes]|uniref:F-box domain-containing protein n=1 Tax=Tetrapyrgos nigripes TaxID=182062 RepID=A0A8H5LSP7_9AGAR|nr:hypothetical protein D9758_004378 [Tetrapyrgos nigripes]
MSSSTTRRRSSRLAELAVQATANTSASSDTVDDQPKRKRARISLDYDSEDEDEDEEKVPKLRGNRGKLEKLTEIPLDILFEIFGYLTPYDVLRLARTTKGLRTLLMSKSSSSVWQAARSNVPALPSPLAGMSEPEYANLTFDARCHSCNSLRCENIIWRFSTRLCNRCLPLLFTPTENLTAPDFMPMLWQYKKMHGYLLLDCVPHISITPGKEPFRTASKNLSLERAYLQPLVDRLLNEYRNTKDDSSALAAWIKLKDTKAYEQWHSARLANRSEELEKTRVRRREAWVSYNLDFSLPHSPSSSYSILQRLSKQGWEKEVKFVKEHRSWDFNKHALVYQTKDLTDRIWKNIEEPMTQFMEQIRIIRIRKECRPRYTILRKVYPEYVDLQPPDLLVPIIGDVLPLNLVKEIAEQPCSEEDPLDEDIFQPLLDLLPEISRAWASEVEEELVKIAKATKPDFQPSSLKLATTVFQCNSLYCKERMSYDMILKHSCATSARFTAQGERRPEQFSGQIEDADFFGAMPWNEGGDRVNFDLVGSAKAKVIVEKLGLDPAITTGENLDRGDYAFECTRCKRKRDGRECRYLMRWQKALNHSCKTQFLVKNPREGPEHEAFLRAETEAVFDGDRRHSWGWGARPVQKALACKHEGCSQRFSYDGFKQHLFDVHQKRKVESSDWTWSACATFSEVYKDLWVPVRKTA